MRQSFRINTLPVVLLAVLAVVHVAHVGARDITECTGVTNGQYITHTRPNCRYSLIYCNGQDSQFCDARNLCDVNYNCAEANPNDSSSTTSTTNPITGSTTNGTTISTTTVSTTTASPLDARAHCRHGVTRKYKYPNNCTYYFYCIDGYLVVEMCPIGYAFNAQSGTCSGRVTDFVACRAAS